ncbi:MAG: hypothetical protein H6943_07810 [Zoogloeaceae bacterium]|nr:hypothetical protein [Zoogloeaceae bacterium]
MHLSYEKLKNGFRNLFRIRQKRRPLPPGTRPLVDTYICRGNLKMLVTHEMDEALWHWLAERNWRKPTMPNDRRQYRYLPLKAFKVIVRASEEERESIYQRVMAARTRSRPHSQSAEVVRSKLLRHKVARQHSPAPAIKR